MISVALCTYNGEKYIGEQLQSIITQTVTPDEIIVCDDCSQDNTVSIVRAALNNYKGHWQVVCNQNNLGYRKNFEKAIGLCHGDLIFLSDQDDVWNMNKIEVMEAAFEDPEVILAFHDAELVDEKLRRLAVSFWETMHFDSDLFQQGDFRHIFAHNAMQGAASCFRKQLYQQAIPFSEWGVHDEWLLLIGLCTGKVIPVKKTLLQYRQAQNAIGGIPMTMTEKISKWGLSIREAIQEHAIYLKKRAALYGDLVTHFDNIEPKNFDFYNSISLFEDFLQKRLYAVMYGENYPQRGAYSVWYLKQDALKQCIKDHLTKLRMWF
ncbi:glycosyltransferase family 2 protein [uncultured Megasphaera sp.]|uniref:glycosyltransferase family 2 protein n=1 Tax=uncultured Megasphaera sp. TaxID=165188 RepID=UPI0026378BC2|nr:glycosyltransferase family 2 protein [uncultured Megasphaera sp.]